MPRGVPTIIAIAVLAAGVGLWAHWAKQEYLIAAEAPVTSRPVPAQGWGPMRVMTANIRLDEPSDGDNAWVKRRELAAKTILKIQPEILACQEVSPVQGAYLAKELSTWYSYYPRAGVGSDSGTSRGAGAELLGALSQSLASLNTLYYRTDRFDILDGEAGLVLPAEPQADAAENTFFTLAIFQEKLGANEEIKHLPAKHTLIVVDIHFRHGEPFALRCEAKLKEKLAAWQAKFPDSGILVMGDINRDKTTKLYAALSDTPATTPATTQHVLTLQDTFDYSQWVGGSGKTWGTYHAFSGIARNPWPTDLIFFGGGLKVTHAAQIIEDHSAPAGTAPARYPSDHFFVQAELGW